MGFYLAIRHSLAVFVSAFSGLISFGDLQIRGTAVKRWQWLFIIEGSMILITEIIGFFINSSSLARVWFLRDR